MATWTLDQLVSQLETALDVENDTHLSTTQKREFIAEAATEAWDEIVSSGMSELYVKNTSFNTAVGTLEYDLTNSSIVAAQDFYKIHQVYVNEGNGHLRPLTRINPAEIHAFRPPQTVVSIKLYYIKTPPTFKTAGSFSGSATIDLPPQAEKLIVHLAAEKARIKRDEDTRPHLRVVERARANIKSMGNVDWSQPQRVVQRRKRRPSDWSMPFLNNVSAYGIRGNKLELYYAYPWVP